MPSLKNAFLSPSCSSSSSSPSDSPLKHDSEDVTYGGSGSKPRLTRQRKLRHVSGEELGLGPSNDQSGHLPVSPPGSGSRSPTKLRHRSMAAVPQPLPLPEFNSFLKQNDLSRLPKEGPGRGDGGGREGHPSTSSTGSYNGHQTTRKFTGHVAKKSSESATYRQRGFHQDLNAESGQDHFRLNIPARSAPNSGFSSPAVSPQRFSTVDLFHSYVLVPPEFQTSSALEFSVFDRLSGSSSHTPPTRITQSPENSPLHSPTLQSPCRNARSTSSAFEASFFDRLSGSSSQTLPTRITQSPDNSPLHSPTLQSPCRNARSPNRVALHSHHISLPEKSTARPEGNSPTNFHPLPLPPGVSKPSHPITIHPLMEKPDGSLMKSHWQKGKLIGRGTFGSVYLATNRETGALCAMKEVDIIADDPKSAECIKQLEQEIKVLRHLKHPNIVQYYGSEIIEDRFCIYLEYVYPGSINKYVREHCGAVTESVVRNFTRHILSGLAYLHNTKTIHRDIKGANLLVDASGVVKLADFGLAKHLTGLVTDLSLNGSPHWMAPEVLQAVMRKDGKSELAFAVDIWSLGCTVLEMLNGKPPWSEFNGVQAMFNVLHRSPPIPETLSSEGKDFLRRCFQRNPADRPSAAMLLEHAFLRNSCAQNVLVCAQEFSGMKLMDTSHSPRDRNTHVKELMPISPHAQIRHGKLPCNSECSVRSYLETSDTGATSRYSPRSTLEVLPNVSSPELNSSPRNISPSLNISNSLLIGAGSNYPYIFSRPHGREIPHI